MYLVQQTAFAFRQRYFPKFAGTIRKYWYSSLGMKIGYGTYIPKSFITWPNQVAIGNNCILEHNVYFKCHGIQQHCITIRIKDNVFIGAGCEFNIGKGLEIGSNTLIASGCRFVDHDHGIQLGKLIGPQPGYRSSIVVGDDVWLGCNVVVLKGVIIGDGAVVAAGAVVTKSIPSNEIWGGVPAKKISQRKP